MNNPGKRPGTKTESRFLPEAPTATQRGAAATT